MKKKILLTGATGFLGSHLLKSFINQGFEVALLKRSTSDCWRIESLLNQTETFDVDIISLEKIFDHVKPAIIVHTACNYGRSNENIMDIVDANLVFGLRLLEEGIKNNVQTFFNTDSLLPRNLNKYSLSKGQFSDWLYRSANQIQIINFKIEHMYGPSDDSNLF